MWRVLQGNAKGEIDRAGIATKFEQERQERKEPAVSARNMTTDRVNRGWNGLGSAGTHPGQLGESQRDRSVSSIPTLARLQKIKRCSRDKGNNPQDETPRAWVWVPAMAAEQQRAASRRCPACFCPCLPRCLAVACFRWQRSLDTERCL